MPPNGSMESRARDNPAVSSPLTTRNFADNNVMKNVSDVRVTKMRKAEDSRKEGKQSPFTINERHQICI